MNGQATPEYRRAADVIKSQIKPGDIGSVITIPHIQGLAGTTYSTARRTADHLTAEGILRPHQGKGYEVIATPQQAGDRRADARELAAQVAGLREEVRALSARLDAGGEFGERLERVESNLEDLFDKLGFEYATDGTGEPPAARRGRTG